MGKPTSTGTQTVTQVNPTQQAQLPYLAGGWEAAQNLYDANIMQPYGGQTLADWGRPEQITGYQNLYNTGVANESIRAAANNPFYQATSGAYGVQNSPAYGGLNALGSGTSAPQQSLAYNAQALGNTGAQAGSTGNWYGDQLAYNAAGVPGVTAPSMNLMGQTAGGAYLNSNPYLDDMYSSAADATTRAYQTATAPRTDSSYEAAGRYGSPSYSNAVSQNEQNLGSTLGNLSADIYGTAYSQERQLQEQAAQNMGQLGLQTAQTQQQGYNLAGGQELQGLSQQAAAQQGAGTLSAANAGLMQNALSTMQTGYQTGNQQALQGSALSPALIQNGITNANTMVAAGQGLENIQQKQINDEVARYNAQMMAPYNQLDAYLRQIGQPTGPSGSGTTQQPIYGDPLGSAIGTVGGVNYLTGNPLGLGATAAGTAAAISPELAATSALGLGYGTTASTGILPWLMGLIPSDRRLKHDDKVIGNIGALPLHTFRYKDDPEQRTRIGFMADEVEQIDPGAVVTTNLGFAAVDYGRAAQSALRAA